MESINSNGKVFTGKWAETAARLGLAKPTKEMVKKEEKKEVKKAPAKAEPKKVVKKAPKKKK